MNSRTRYVLLVFHILQAWILASEFFATELFAQHIITVSPQGKNDNQGTLDSPFSFSGAIDHLHHLLEQDEYPEMGILVNVQGGVYPWTTPYVLPSQFSGTADHPLIIKAVGSDPVIFDGSLSIDASSFAPVTAKEDRSRLAQSCADKIVTTTLRDPRLIQRLRSKVVLGLLIDGVTYFPARFPNVGFAQMASKVVQDEVSPPAVPRGKEAYGVRAGQPPYLEPAKGAGWLGSLTEPRGAVARFGARGDEMAGTWSQWEFELNRDNTRNVLTGFLDANWLLRSQAIVAADTEAEAIHLSQALAYGWDWKKHDKPFHVFGLLCELDRPGEWYFDVQDHRLYLYPPVPLETETDIRLPVADGFLHLTGARHVHLIGLSVRNAAGGIIYRFDGSHNLLAGSEVRNCTSTGVRLNGTDQRVVGCDFVDLNQHVQLSGGKRGPRAIEPGGNTVENCHIYQSEFRHQRVTVSVSGVGNALRNNLIHNSLGQAVTVRGNDHRIERNELFNIGYAEGDGGAIYSGGDLTGYGNVYRQNFFHHLMHVAGKVERSGIHLDDLQAGSTCIGNVFYKSAGKGIFMNGGAGHRIQGNVFLNGYRGIYNVGKGAQGVFDLQQQITQDPQHPRLHAKENYVGRAEKIVGSDGWNREPWRSRYPLFRDVMNDTGTFGRLWPIRCHVADNHYFDNEKGDRTLWSRVAVEAREKSIIENERILSPEIFVDYDTLDLRIRDGVENAPDIPYESIGLFLGPYRRSMPDKSHYRAAVRRYFKGHSCMSGRDIRLDSAPLIEHGPQISH